MRIADAYGSIINIDLDTGAHGAYMMQDAYGGLIMVPAAAGGYNAKNLSEAVQRRPAGSYPGYALLDDAGAATVLAKFGATGAVAADLTTGYIGGRSIKITTDGTANYTDVRGTLPAAVNFIGKIPMLAIWVEDDTKIEELQLTLGSGGALTVFKRWQAIEGNQGNKWLRSGEWMLIPLPWQDSAITGGFNRAAVTNIQLRVRSSALGATNVWIGGIFAASASPGVATVSFDDGYASVYSRAYPVLKARGIKSTVYMIGDYLGANGRLTLKQMREMRDSGLVEIGYHGTGNDQRVNSMLALREIIEKDLAKWRQHRIAIRTAAYPGGEDDLTTDGYLIRDIYADYFESSRMIYQGQSESIPPGDALRLRVSSYVTNATTPATVAASVAATVANGGWHHQVYHDIVASGAAASTEYNLADFTTNMDAIAATSLSRKTVTEALS